METKLSFCIITSAGSQPLSKKFYLKQPDGTLIKDKGTAGRMTKGHSKTYQLDFPELLKTIEGTNTKQGVVWGIPEYPEALVVTKENAKKSKAVSAESDFTGLPIISRSKDCFRWNDGPGILQIDVDDLESGDKSEIVLQRLYDLISGLSESVQAIRPSGSSLIYRTADGECLRGVNGFRVLVPVMQQQDLDRFRKALFHAAWVNGHGFVKVGDAGQALTRCKPFDHMAIGRERWDFLGGAVCGEGLEQRLPAFRIINPGGPMLNTLKAVPVDAERDRKALELIRDAVKAVKPEIEKAQTEYTRQRVEKAVNDGMPEAQAERLFKAAVRHRTLFGDFPIQLESGETVTVGNLLDDPGKYHNTRCHDPLDPGSYGGDKRIGWINLRGTRGGTIKSFAHGGAVYRLRRPREKVSYVPELIDQVTDQAIELLGMTDEDVFVHGGQLVRINGNPTRPTQFFPVGDLNGMKALLDEKITFMKPKAMKDGQVEEIPISCPRDLAGAVLSVPWRWEKGIPELIRIIDRPLFDTASGAVVDADGYHDRTMTLIRRHPDLGTFPDIPEKPTDDNIRDALRVIWQPIRKYPFVGPTDRGVFLAAALTGLIRDQIPISPLFLIRSNVPGTGKSLLCDVITGIGSHKPIPTLPWPKDPDEQRKALFAMLAKGQPAASYDNLRGTIRSDELCRICTSEMTQDRQLQHTRILTFHNRTLILLNGNNCVPSEDLTRRLLVCNIDAAVEDPTDRDFDFIPSEVVRENRTEILAACFTLLRAGMQADLKVKANGSFPEWQRSVRKAVLRVMQAVPTGNDGLPWIGDPWESIKANKAADPATEILRMVLMDWFSFFGDKPQTLKDLKQVLDTGEMLGDEIPRLAEQLVNASGGKPGHIDPRRLGYWLRAQAGVVVSSLRFKQAGTDRTGTALWKVEQILNDTL